MSKISELSDGGVIQGGDTLIAVRSGGNVKVTYGGTTTANIDGGTIDGTTIGGTTPAAGSFTTGSFTGTVTADGLTVDSSEAKILGGSFTSGATTTLIIGSGTNTADSIHGIQFRDRYGASGFPDGQIGAFVQAERDGTGGDYDLVLGTTGDNSADAVQRLRIEDTGDISFYEDTGTTAKMVWKSADERLGIGTSSPASRLEVSNGDTSANAAAAILTITNESQAVTAADVALGKIEFVSNDPSSGGTGVGGSIGVLSERPFDGGPANTYMAFSTRTSATNTERMRIDSSGNVGIGTDSPNYKLEINHTGADTNALVLNDEDTVSNATGIYLRSTSEGRISVGSGAALTFATNGGVTEAMRIDSSGNVGIGTSLPGKKLHLQIPAVGSGSGEVAIKMAVPSDIISAQNEIRTGVTSGTNPYMSFAVRETDSPFATVERLRIDSSGNVGVGTSSPVNDSGYTGLTLSGTTGGQVVLQDDGTTEGLIWTNNAFNIEAKSTNPMVFRANGSEAMRIDSSGNLLVGATTSPASTNPKTVRYGNGVQAGSLSSRVALTAGVTGDVIDMAGVTTSTQGAGMYLVTIVRKGASYATNFVGIFGVNSSSVTLYQTLQSNGMTVSVSGTTIRCNSTSTDTHNCNVIPLAVNPS